MNAADRALGRRGFLGRLFGIGAGVALGDDVWDNLDLLAPRPTIVPGVRMGYAADAWYEAPFYMSDNDMLTFTTTGRVPLVVEDAARALVGVFEPGTMSPVRLSVMRQYKQDVFTLDAIGAKRGAEKVVINEPLVSDVVGLSRTDPRYRYLPSGMSDLVAALQRDIDQRIVRRYS